MRCDSFATSRSAGVWVFLLITSLLWRCQTRGDDRTVFLRFAGPPAAEVALFPATRGPAPAVAGTLSAAQQRIAEIESSHALAEPLLELAGAKITGRYSRLANAIAVRVPVESLDSLRAIDDVIEIVPVGIYDRQLESSVHFIGSTQLWGTHSSNATGAGIRIGIIDSGIDYHHAAFAGSGNPDDFDNNNPTLIEIGSFPTGKIAGGFDFSGDNYDARGQNGRPFPVPDFDPLDPRLNGHGTHVASIAAGYGVLTNGIPYTGPFNSSLNMSRFTVAPGVAPAASLFALKVFGREGSTSGDLILRALEWALDPDNNGNFEDRLDVVNLSLGGVFESVDAGNVEASGVNLLSRSGVTVVVAGGNAGNIHYVMGIPAALDHAITIANSIDSGATFSTIKITSPPPLANDYTSVEGEFTAKLSIVGPVTAEVALVEPALACGNLQNPTALQNKIALIDRGTCFFIDKIRRAQLAGAIGVIMVNNLDGPPIVMGGQGDTSDIRIPGVMIRLEDGNLIKSQLKNGVIATLAAFAAVARPELADQLENSSSRGPRLPDSHLKPDLAAPGTSILAAESGAGTQGRLFSGTSMASPHVTGAVALLKQLHPTWGPMDMKMALMNSAVPTKNDRGIPYSESRTGAGRVQVGDAAQLTTLARVEGSPGEVALSFGALQLFAPYTATKNVRIFNLSNQPQTYQLRSSNTVLETGVSLTPLLQSITIAARGSDLVPVRFDATPVQFDRSRDPTTPTFIGDKARHQLFEASGQLWIHTDTHSIHLPWFSIVRALSDARVTATSIGMPPNASSTVRLPTRGPQAHSKPLVSLFQLGLTNASRGFSDDRASGDLVAFGAASDRNAQETMAQAKVYFGLVTAGAWVTPQRPFVSFDVDIDLNADNAAEYTLLSSTSGNLLSGRIHDPQDMTDAFLTIVRDNSKQTNNLTAGATLNVLPPDVRDTAPYHNAAAILAAPAALIGLSDSQATFRYRIVTTALGFTETSAWSFFDAATPLIDAAPHGINRAPIFDEGLTPTAFVHRSAAVAEGFGPSKPLRALAIHHHNPVGQQINIVTFDLDNPDIDGDGRRDVDEMENFGDLTSDGTGDQDGDGLGDLDELFAGTDPRSATSTFSISIERMPAFQIRWNSLTGRTYTVEAATSLLGPFRSLKTGIPATPPINRFDEVDPNSTETFFRLRIE